MAIDKDEKVADDAEALYKQVAELSRNEDTGVHSKIFHQDDLQNLIESADPKDLMPLIQWLSNRSLLRTLKLGGRLGWSVRPRDAARQIVTLEREEKMIYEVIEEAHDSGVWSREIKKKTGLAETLMRKTLDRMVKSNLIKNVKAVRNPAHKIYMLAHLQASEEVTGNSFYDAGDLDESFRDELLNLIVHYVRANSWEENTRKKSHKRGPSSPTLTANNLDSRKRKRTDDIEDIARPIKHRSLEVNPDTDFTQLTYKAGTHDYPTAETILQWIQTTRAVKPVKASTLTVQEIQGCLDVLCWDDKLERMPNKNSLASGYRSIRGVYPRAANQADEEKDYPGTGFTQAPCGRCPVFDLCHEGGPVNPQECVYFEQWLE